MSEYDHIKRRRQQMAGDKGQSEVQEKSKYTIVLPPHSKKIGQQIWKEIFLKKDVFIKALLPTLPILLVLSAASFFFLNEEKYWISILLNCLYIWVSVDYTMKWHSIFLDKEAGKGLNWYSPNKPYLMFFFYIICVYLITYLPIMLALILVIFSSLFFTLLLLSLAFLAFFKLNMIFPSIVSGHNIKLSEIWELSGDLAMKIFWAPIRSNIFVIPMMVAFFFLPNIIESVAVESFVLALLLQITLLFMGIFYSCLFIGSLCNYYRWVELNRLNSDGSLKHG